MGAIITFEFHFRGLILWNNFELGDGIIRWFGREQGDGSMGRGAWGWELGDGIVGMGAWEREV